MQKTANVFSDVSKAFGKGRKVKKLLNAQKESKIARPDLKKMLEKEKAEHDRNLYTGISKIVGGTAIIGYTADKIRDRIKQGKNDVLNSLGHRGADYAGIRI